MAIEWRRESTRLSGLYDDELSIYGDERFLHDGGLVLYNDELILYDQGQEAEILTISPVINKTLERRFTTRICIDRD